MKDIMLRGMLMDKTARFLAISGKELVEAARRTHSLSRVCTAALGRSLMMTSMMGTTLKHENEKLTTMLKGGGMAGNVVCTAKSTGEVKGYIENPSLELPPAPNGKLDVALAVGWFGEVKVIRDMYMKEPYVGTCPMVSGEIAEDFANYFTVSEQQPSLVYLGVRVDIETQETLSAGGVLIQTLPSCPEETTEKLTEKAKAIAELSKRLEEGESLLDVLKAVFSDADMEILESYAPAYRCDCSRERLEKVLVALGKDELLDMAEKDRGAELTCQFCNTKYAFSEAELRKLIEEAKS